jgi:hypothetical protein
VADSGRGMEAGESTCHIVTGQVKLSVDVDVGKIRTLLPSNVKTLDLEGGAKGVYMGDAGWISFIRFANFDVTLLPAGTAVTFNHDKKIAQVTKANNMVVAYAQFREALARTAAHNRDDGRASARRRVRRERQG